MAFTRIDCQHTLAGLRLQECRTAAPEAFIGWGDPDLKGKNTWQVSGPTTCPTAHYRGSGSPSEFNIRHPKSVSQSHANVDRGVLADISKVRDLPPLPDSAQELQCVAKSLMAPPSAIHLGPNATETAVKLAQLDRYRTVMFATHGLLAGEVQQLAQVGAEPALVLTPPDRPTETDDGLLTASEIAALKLKADLVILSACNTAAGDAENSEELSGLARSFFYAGAHALLVSHWAVDSWSATTLITSAIAELACNPSIGRAEALRRSMVAYIEDPDQGSAQPTYWAPFFVVGEGSGFCNSKGDKNEVKTISSCSMH